MDQDDAEWERAKQVVREAIVEMEKADRAAQLDEAAFRQRHADTIAKLEELEAERERQKLNWEQEDSEHDSEDVEFAEDKEGADAEGGQ